MPRKVFDITEIGFEVQSHATEIKEAYYDALNKATHLAKNYLMVMTPKDRGNLAASWKTGFGKVYNDAPYAAAMDEGARPHKVGMAAIENITGWAMRTFGVDAQEGKNIAFGVAKKIAEEGFEGTHFVSESLPRVAELMGMVVMQELKRRI